MVRRKIKIKLIDNATTRQVTFSKRRGGLLKKAHDLAVLCDAEVGVIIFSGKGKLFSFASPSMGSVLERYAQSSGSSKAPNNNDVCHVSAPNKLTEFFDGLKNLQSNLIGDDFERLCLRDLIHLEQKVQHNLGQIRSKKEELLLEQLDYVKEKVTEAQRTTNVNSSVLEKLVDFCSDENGCQDLSHQGDLECVCLQEARRTNWCLPAANSRSRITEDLNKSPAANTEE